MLSFLKLLLFSPWLSFLVIAQGSLLRLKLGLVVALVLSVVMGLSRLHRGVILWTGLTFFSYATIAVALLNDVWTARHMGGAGQRRPGACFLAYHRRQEAVLPGLRPGAH